LLNNKKASSKSNRSRITQATEQKRKSSISLVTLLPNNFISTLCDKKADYLHIIYGLLLVILSLSHQ